MELDRDGPAGAEPVSAGIEQAAVRVEPVAGREHGLRRLVGKVGEDRGIARWKVGQVRDHQVDRAGDGVEQVAVPDRDPLVEAVLTRWRG